jgi:hypothetical protein
MGRQYSEEEQWAKINIGRKRPPCNEKDCFEKSQNYCSRIEYSPKTVRHKLHKCNIHGSAATVKPLII